MLYDALVLRLNRAARGRKHREPLNDNDAAERGPSIRDWERLEREMQPQKRLKKINKLATSLGQQSLNEGKRRTKNKE